jgi:chromosome segregation ATPase
MSIAGRVIGAFSRGSSTDKWEELRESVLDDNGKSTEEVIDSRVSGEDLNNSGRNQKGVESFKIFVKKGSEEMNKVEEKQASLEAKVNEIENWMENLHTQIKNKEGITEIENLVETAERKLEQLDQKEEEFKMPLKDAERYFRAAKEVSRTDDVKVGLNHNGVNVDQKIKEIKNVEKELGNEKQEIEEFEEVVMNAKRKIDEVSEIDGDKGIERQREAVEQISENMKSFLENKGYDSS